MRALFPLLLLLPTACVSMAGDRPLGSRDPGFDAIAFFEGTTVGAGTLDTIKAHPHRVTVNGQGVVDDDGWLTLTQQVAEQGKPVKERVWRIHQDSPGHYIGTLSDAVGQVAGSSDGNRLHLRFRTKSGLRINQTLYLSEDGQSALNQMVVHKMGMRVAALSETIERR